MHEAGKATEASSAVATGFPPSPGFPAASPAKDLLLNFEQSLVHARQRVGILI